MSKIIASPYATLFEFMNLSYRVKSGHKARTLSALMPTSCARHANAVDGAVSACAYVGGIGFRNTECRCESGDRNCC